MRNFSARVGVYTAGCMSRLASSIDGNGEPLVLLHGMATSSRYWDKLVPSLSRQYRVVRLDLLGFGRSPKPHDVTYDYPTHITNIVETLDSLHIAEPIVFVGHSMGALLALRFARLHPQRVKRLVLIAMPFYKDSAATQQSLTGGTWYKKLAYYGPTSQLLCNLWCRALRPVSKRIAPFYLRSLPKQVAADSVLHTWQAYAQSRDLIIAHQTVLEDLGQYSGPTTLLYGTDESAAKQVPAAAVRSLKHVKFVRIAGGHNIPLTHSSAVVDYILAQD